MSHIKDLADPKATHVLIYAGDGGCYWRDGGCGYTNRNVAGKFTREEAYKLAGHCGPEKRVELHDVPDDHVPTLRAEVERLTRERDEAKAIGCICLNAFKALQMAAENKIDEKTFTSVIESSATAMGQAADWLKDYTDTFAQQNIDLRAERDQLREQLAAAKKDSERIDWLKADMPTSLIAWTDAASGCRLVQAGDSRGIGQDIRLAIDAARTPKEATNADNNPER